MKVPPHPGTKAGIRTQAKNDGKRSVALPLMWTSISVLVIGLVVLAVGVVQQATWDQPDANIGAGLLVLAAIPLLLIAIVLGIVALVLRSRRTR